MPTTIQTEIVHDVQIGTAPASEYPALIAAFRAEHGLDALVVVQARSSVGRRDQNSGFVRWRTTLSTTMATITLEFVDATSMADANSGLHDIGIRVTTEDLAPTRVGASVNVRDLLTGSAIIEPNSGWEYTYSPNPKTVLIPVGTPHNFVINVQVDVNAE